MAKGTRSPEKKKGTTMNILGALFEEAREKLDAIIVDLRFLKGSLPKELGYDVRRLLMYDHSGSPSSDA